MNARYSCKDKCDKIMERGKNILAIVITYNPDVELLQRNIDSFIKYVDRIIIWNNTPGDINNKSCNIQTHTEKVIYKGNGQNIGISRALNYAWRYAINEQYDYLLTMDQDSVWVNFDLFLEKVSAHGIQAIYGPSYVKNQQEDYMKVGYRITSGMLVPISIINTVKGYNTDFIIDGIDVDFCYRAKMKGYLTYNVSGAWLNHKVGDQQKMSFCGKEFTTYNYSPVRIYGICRNHILIWKEYEVDPIFRFFMKEYLLKMPLKVLLGEKNKASKLKSFFLGVFDGLFGRYFFKNEFEL